MASLIPALWLTVGSVVVATAIVLIASATGANGWAGPVYGGMIGPLVAVVATWVLVVGAYRRDAASVWSVMMRAFLVKVGFFIVYVAAAIKIAGLPGREFGISFVAWFIALYAAQAVLMRRLFSEGLKGAR